MLTSKVFSAIDMGTNSFHMIIVRIKKDGTFKFLDKEREVVRIGSGASSGLGEITEDDIKKTIYLLNNFKRLANRYHSKPRAIATSAIREARNKNDFVDRVKSETGIEIQIIDGKSEARLIYLGMDQALNLKNKNVIGFDIGGGSTEFIYSQKGKIKSIESLKLGAVRLSNMFFTDHLVNDKNVNECRNYIEDIFNKSSIPFSDIKYEIAVGASGTIQSVGFIISTIKNNKLPKSMNDFLISSKDFKMVLNKVLSGKTTKERTKIAGMEEKRADILPAGLLILECIFKLFKIKQLKISEYALREGIIIDSYNKYLNQPAL